MRNFRTYSHLLSLPTFEERFEYLKLGGTVGSDTFGSYRYLNQGFYHSSEWRSIRNSIILRDNGCDLGCEDRPIQGKVIIHHINPIEEFDLVHMDEAVLDPENLICVSMLTHNAIHYGDIDLLPQNPIERTPGDTCPWKGGTQWRVL